MLNFNDFNVLQNDDKERERQLFNDEEVRHLNMKKKEVKNKYGLWDNVYDKRIIRTLDTNTKWAPSKKENEKRAKVKQKKQLKEKKKTNSTGGDEADAEADDEGSEKSNSGPQPGSGDESVDWDEDDAFSDSKKKWIPTGTLKFQSRFPSSCILPRNVQ